MPRPGDEGGGGRIRRPPIARARQHIGRVGWNPGGGGGSAPAPAPTPQPTPNQDPYDYSMDPLLQRIRAAGTARIGEGEAEALRARKQLLIDYGDPDLARSLGLDETTIQAAGQNPFSIRSRLNRESVERPKSLTENLSGGGLMYSSEFGKQHSDLSRMLLEDQSRASATAREGLSGIDRGLMELRREVEQDNMEAEEAAAERLRERLGDLPVGGGAAGGGGTSGGNQSLIGGSTRTRLGEMLRPRPGHGRPNPRPNRPPGWRP